MLNLMWMLLMELEERGLSFVSMVYDLTRGDNLE